MNDKAAASPSPQRDSWSASRDDEIIVNRCADIFQSATKSNDAATLSVLLLDGMVSISGSGFWAEKEVLVAQASNRDFTYEHHEEIPETRTVRFYGPDTAVVSAELWIKGRMSSVSSGGFEHRFLFSATYVRSPEGWRLAFNQSSTPRAPGET